MRQYTILAGSFVLDDGSRKHAGDTIELEDDVAAQHAGRVALQEAAAPAEAPAKPAVQTPARAAAKD
jgi:hypothetical protein